MPKGAGYMSAGYSPAGLSESETWADLPEPFEGVRFIDPRVRDYALNDDGTFQRMGQTQQRVVLALITLLDSANGVPGFGVRFPDYMDQNYARTVRLRVQEALAHLENEIVIRNIDVEVEAGSAGRSRITVEYTDLATDEDDRVRV